jgi:hypothetical protein
MCCKAVESLRPRREGGRFDGITIHYVTSYTIAIFSQIKDCDKSRTRFRGFDTHLSIANIKTPSFDEVFILVTPAGFEPAIFWMRTRYPGPLDDGATVFLTKLILLYFHPTVHLCIYVVFVCVTCNNKHMRLYNNGGIV